MQSWMSHHHFASLDANWCVTFQLTSSRLIIFATPYGAIPLPTCQSMEVVEDMEAGNNNNNDQKDLC